MEKIIYRLTLDAHKNGIQKTLQGFETADKVARQIVVSLTSGSDTYEIADNVVAMMYVTTPNATVPSVNACKIEGNTIIYDVLPIEEAGITYMQLKLIGTDEEGVESVLASPKVSVEVEESMMDDNAVEQTTTFTALEEAIAKAEVTYNKRLLNVEIDDDCVFRAYYADGTVYENNEIQIEVHEYIDEVMEEHLASINNSVSQAKSSEEKAKLSEANAKLSEDNIKLSEASAKLSEENAKASEANAKQYMENAFHTTPEGYEELVEKVNAGSSEDIKTSTDFVLHNTKNGGLKFVDLFGNTEKVGNSFKGVGEYDANTGMYVVPIRTHTKNIIKNHLMSMIEYGLLFRRNEDGSVTVKGTNTTNYPSGVMVTSQKKISLKNGSYILSGAPKGSSERTCWLEMSNYDADGSRNRVFDYGNGVTFDFGNEGGSYSITIMVDRGATVDATFYPMLRNADIEDDTYEPHGESLANIYLDAPLRKVGEHADRIGVKDGVIGVERNVVEIKSYANETIETEYISTTDGLTNGATVQYATKRPTFTPLSEENLRSLYGLNTFVPNTCIDVDTSVKPSGINVMYGTSEGCALALENECSHKQLELEVNNAVDNIEIKTTSDTTIRNAKHGGLRLTKMVGNTEQKKLSGKNFFDYNKTNITLVKGSTRAIHVNAKDNINLKAGSYKVVVPDLVLSNNNYLLGCQLIAPNGSNKGTLSMSNTNGVFNTVLLTEDVIINRLYFYLASTDNDTATATFSEIMLVKDDVTDYTFEEYCGGTPSPNPLYEQPLYHTSDVVEMIQGGFANGAYTNSTVSVCNKNKIPCKSGDIVKVVTEKAYNIAIFMFDKDGKALSYNSLNNVKSNEMTTPINATYWAYHIQHADGLTPDTVGKITLTINGKYVNCVKGHWKNFLDLRNFVTRNNFGVTATPFFDEHGELEYIEANGTSTSNVNITLAYIDVKEPTEFILSGSPSNATNFGAMLRIYSPEGIALGTNNSDEGVKITLPKGLCEVRFRVNSQNTVSNLKFYPMIRKADILDDTYEPYRETVAYFLTEKQMMLGSTLFHENGLFKVEHGRTEKTIENVLDVNYLAENYGGRAYCSITPSDKKKDVTRTAISNKATYSTNIADNMFYENPTNFVFVGTADDTLETMQAKYNGTVIQYELATPTIEVLDTESQLALHSLETFDGVTYIEVDSRVKPLGIECEYGTSQVGAYTLKSLLNSESNTVRLNALLEAQAVVEEPVE